VLCNASSIGDEEIKALGACTGLKALKLAQHRFNDLSFLSLLPNLEVLELGRASFYSNNLPSIRDIFPVTHCPHLRILSLGGQRTLMDLSPLSQCTMLETLELIECGQLKDLSPLVHHPNLRTVFCYGLDRETSYLPLATCPQLKTLKSDLAPGSDEFQELRRRRPDLELLG